MRIAGNLAREQAGPRHGVERRRRVPVGRIVRVPPGQVMLIAGSNGLTACSNVGA